MFVTHRQPCFKALSAAVYGIDANLIDVEVDYRGAALNEDHFHTMACPTLQCAKAAPGESLGNFPADRV